MTREELLADMDAADKAGDYELSKAIAARLDQMNAQSTHKDSYQAKAVKGPGGVMDFLGGIGQGVGDLGRGIKQRGVDLGVMLGAVPPTVQGRLYAEEQAKRNERDYGGKDTGAAAMGRLIGENAAAIPAMLIPGPNTLAGSTATAALIGGAMGGMYPTTKPGEALSNAAGGALFSGLGNVGARAVLPTGARNLTESQKEIINIAKREGIPLRTSEATGSTAMKNLEAVASNRFVTGPMEQRFNEAQTRAVNRAMTKRLGKPVDEVTPEVLKQFGDDLGAEVGKFTQGKTVDLTDFAVAVADLDQKMNKGGALTRTADVEKLVKDSVSLLSQKRQLPGPVVQDVKSMLQDRMRDAYKADKTELGDSLKTLVDGLNKSISKTMAPEEMAAWKAANRKYANYKAIEDIMQRNPKAVAEGDLPVKQLARALERQHSNAYAKGTADLADVAMLGQMLNRPQHSALVGATGDAFIPGLGLARDYGRGLLYPAIQSKAAQTYLTGAALKPIRDSKAATRTLDATMRSLGLLSIDDQIDEAR